MNKVTSLTLSKGYDFFIFSTPPRRIDNFLSTVATF